MTLWKIADLLNDPDGNYCSNATVIHYIETDKGEVDKVYLANRWDIVKRVERLYIPEATAKEAWGNLWAAIQLQQLQPCQ